MAAAPGAARAAVPRWRFRPRRKPRKRRPAGRSAGRERPGARGREPRLPYGQPAPHGHPRHAVPQTDLSQVTPASRSPPAACSGSTRPGLAVPLALRTFQSDRYDPSGTGPVRSPSVRDSRLVSVASTPPPVTAIAVSGTQRRASCWRRRQTGSRRCRNGPERGVDPDSADGGHDCAGLLPAHDVLLTRVAGGRYGVR